MKLKQIGIYHFIASDDGQTKIKRAQKTSKRNIKHAHRASRDEWHHLICIGIIAAARLTILHLCWLSPMHAEKSDWSENTNWTAPKSRQWPFASLLFRWTFTTAIRFCCHQILKNATAKTDTHHQNGISGVRALTSLVFLSVLLPA